MGNRDNRATEPALEAERAAEEEMKRIARLRRAAVGLDSKPGLLATTRRLRQQLPGDE